jgi:hypothetical protein
MPSRDTQVGGARHVADVFGLAIVEVHGDPGARYPLGVLISESAFD